MLKLYDKLFLQRPAIALLVCFLIVSAFSSQIGKFKLDASADSLVLENDQSLRYFREISSKYNSNDFLLLTFTAKDDLFAKDTLAELGRLRDELAKLDGISSVVTILDVPLLFSPKLSVTELATKRTIETPGVNLQAAKNEFLTNPIYRKQLLSPDGQTTVLILNLPIDHELRRLLQLRTDLRGKRFDKSITKQEQKSLAEVSEQYRSRATKVVTLEKENITQVREIVERHKNRAQLFLGGVPMIISDMISFVKNDLIIFSLGVLAFLLITLITIFKKPRWVIIPVICCLAAGLTMMGLLGLLDWRVTVISSNFISLMLIITMSLTIHLIVCYQELCSQQPDASQRQLLLETVRLKVKPCLYTTLTTVVAFASLLVSSIRPVMDFGLMMTLGLLASFLLSFAIFPAAAMLTDRDIISTATNKKGRVTLAFAHFTEHHGRLIIYLTIGLTIFSLIGIKMLVVENRFIDYFRESTEIYKGMELIDQKLGGTTPLDIIIDLENDNTIEPANTTAPQGNDSADLLADDLLDDDLLTADNLPGLDQDFSADKYWFTSYKMERVAKIHDFLDHLPEVGKVLSIATMVKVATALNDDIALDDYELSALYANLPDDIINFLVAPYVSVQDNQVRISTRIMESNSNLHRAELLQEIQSFLVNEMHFSKEQIHFTNMLVLYNNMLQSLFRSQILTIGVVFLGIMIMFMILFRSVSLAIIAIIPNLLPAFLVLGIMGWFKIPLDMMTITIAAITIGIAVDDTIHYIHRFQEEFRKDRNYKATVYRCHASIGKAMYYTSLTIIIGFSILVLSNFIPTIYFGLFTGFGMITALIAALTLLPQLLIIFKPLGPE